MANIEYRLDRPLWLLLLIPAAILFLVIFFTMRKETRRKAKTVISLVLHGIIAVLLVILAAGFSIGTETDRQSTVILWDVSESTAVAREDMTAACQALLDSFDSEDLKGVVAFGQDTVFLGRRNASGELSFEAVDASGSDIASAMYYAVTLMDKYTHKRIILLSDGKETSGDAAYAAGRLAEEGVRIDTMYFDTNGQAGDEVQISTMTSSGGSYIGDEIGLTVTLQSSLSTTATVTLYEGETLLETREVSLRAGSQTQSFTYTAVTSGMHCYRALLSCASDGETRNNEAFAALRTYGDTSVLIIAADPAAAEGLRETLSAESEVTVVAEDEAPTDLPTLCNYDGFYLMNADAERLPEGFGDALSTAVKLYGKTACFVGGDSTFTRGNMADTVYSDMLPVAFGASDGDTTALLIVIDISASMVNGEINYLELAKIGAIKALDALQPTDYVGVITFASYAQTIVYPTELTAENKKLITEKISDIQNSAGTLYAPALQEAWFVFDDLEAFDGVRPDRKHIIFLSDGEPADGGEQAWGLVQGMREEEITVSTIGMNAERSSLSILEKMAEYGGGEYTYVENAMDLPNIMLGASESVSAQYAYEKPFTPVVAHLDELTRDLSGLPQIGGYVGVRAKEDATVYLTSDRGDPVYATWSWGEGTVTCFASDLSGDWCDTWLSSEAGKCFTRNALTHAYPDTRYDASIIPTVTVDGGRVTVTASLPQASSDDEVIAVITGPEGKKLQLERISSTGFEGNTTLLTAGEYEVTLTWKNKGRVIDETSTVFAVSYSGEYDLFRQGDETLLATASAASGGMLTSDPAALAAVELGVLRSIIPQELTLCAVAAVLMLMDIILRRLSLADVKRLFGR